jgi:hypothetical protein
VNLPPFPPSCLTPDHQLTDIRTRSGADLDRAIVERVLALDRDASSFVLGVIRISAREATLVSQRPLGAESNVCVGITFKDKGAR